MWVNMAVDGGECSSCQARDRMRVLLLLLLLLLLLRRGGLLAHRNRDRHYYSSAVRQVVPRSQMSAASPSTLCTFSAVFRAPAGGNMLA